jgi:cell pole-organizing protein PopZ
VISADLMNMPEFAARISSTWQSSDWRGLAEIAADVRAGTRRDAILYAVAANASHNLKRTNHDKTFPAPIELTAAVFDPCDRFLPVCSSYPFIV